MLRKPKTGGGPAPPSLTASEDALMQAFDWRPQICGLPDGIDTDVTDEIEKGMESSTPASTTSTSACTSSIISKSLTTALESDHSVFSEKSKRKQMKDALEEEELENLRLDKKIKLEIEKLIIEKQKLEAEKELIDVKKAFLVRQFEERFPNSVIYTSTSNSSMINEL